MPDFLVFQLYGVLASWGDIAVGEYRPSRGQPSKSAITGLLAAALGVDREDDATHAKLNRDNGIAICTHIEGELLRDYHTTQVPKGNRKYVNRREELLTDKLKLRTILSQRDYRTDSFYLIATWISGNDAQVTLEDLKNALLKPRFSLYLGRKSCPVSLPLNPVIFSRVNLRQAFDAYYRDEVLEKVDPWIKQQVTTGVNSYFWEQGGLEADDLGLTSSMVYPRRDHVRSRKRWQFATRDEYYYAESIVGEK